MFKNVPNYCHGKYFYNNRKYLKKFSPITQKKIYHYDLLNIKDIDKAIVNSKSVQIKWEKSSNELKSNFLNKIYKEIIKNKHNIAKIESEEIGKPYGKALKEVLESSKLWLYAAKLCKKQKITKVKRSREYKTYFDRFAVGVVNVILPWNFPFVVMSERIPFILAAGNSVVIKPSEFASGSAYELTKIFNKMNNFKGIITTINGEGTTIGSHIIKNKNVDMISFTGSTTTGKKISKLSSQKLINLNLELGGKNPVIVLKDAPIKTSIKKILNGALYNAGQACVSGSLVLVEKKIYKNFCNEVMRQIKYHKSKKYGPIINKKQYANIVNLIQKEKKEGSEPCYNKNKFTKNSFFIEPVVYFNLNQKSKIYREEIFGPIITINSFENIDETIKDLNKSKYGLACYLFSKDKSNISYFLKNIRYGRVWVNDNLINFPELPLGGFRQSGIGRESGVYGLDSYTEIRSVIIKL